MVFFNINRDPFIIYKNFMRFNGVWPLETGKASAVIYAFFLMLEIVTIVTRLIDPHEKCTEQKVGDAEITHTSWYAAAMIMRFTVRVNGNKLIPLIKTTIDDWKSITDPEEREIMKRHDKIGSVIFITRNVGGVVIGFGYACLMVIYPSRFPGYDRRMTCASHEHVIWLTVVAFSSLLVGIVDHFMMNLSMVLIWSFALHLSAQLKILKKRFEQFLLIKNKKKCRQEFRRLVDSHNQLLDLSGSLEDSSCFFIGLHIIRTEILICLLASQLGYAIKAGEFTKLFDILKDIGSSLFVPVIYYYAGDYLAGSSDEIGEVFTQCNWYELSKDSITNFSIVIARTRKPASLTLWKFHKLNLSNLKHSLDALYSYVSLIVGLELDEG